MTPEGRVKGKVNRALKALGADVWRFMPVQSGFGTPALDYLLCIKGRFIAIETKAPGKKLTPMQEGTKAAIEAAGGIVFVVWDETSLEIAMKIILALEFSPNAPNRSESDVVGGCLQTCSVSAPDEKGDQHRITFVARKTVDAAVGRHNGAPRATSRGRTLATTGRDNKRSASLVEHLYLESDVYLKG